jgi:hypothetical protein
MMDTHGVMDTFGCRCLDCCSRSKKEKPLCLSFFIITHRSVVDSIPSSGYPSCSYSHKPHHSQLLRSQIDQYAFTYLSTTHHGQQAGSPVSIPSNSTLVVPKLIR